MVVSSLKMGQVKEIVEQKDCNEAATAYENSVNAGIYSVNTDLLERYIPLT